MVLTRKETLSNGQHVYRYNEQEDQVALNHSPELYLLKAGHVPGDTWGQATFGTRGII